MNDFALLSLSLPLWHCFKQFLLMWGSKQILGDQQINCLRLLDLKELRLDSNDLQGQATQHLKYPPQIRRNQIPTNKTHVWFLKWALSVIISVSYLVATSSCFFKWCFGQITGTYVHDRHACCFLHHCGRMILEVSRLPGYPGSTPPVSTISNDQEKSLILLATWVF